MKEDETRQREDTEGDFRLWETKGPTSEKKSVMDYLWLLKLNSTIKINLRVVN
jgi:hypothetical protein